jgi:phage terminase large subunit-like protein
LTSVPIADRQRGDGADVIEFIETYCAITKDSIAGLVGDPMRLRPWQREGLQHIFARRPDGKRRHRIALYSTARKNGKTALAAGVALYGLTVEQDGAEVYSCAADRDQARLVFGTAKRMVELHPELSEDIRLYRDVLEHKPSGSIYRALSSEAFTKEGLSPTLTVYDELHAAPDDELFNVMQLASGARVDPLMLIVTTAGVQKDRLGQDSICYRLYKYGKQVVSGEVSDPSFFMAWWEPHDLTSPLADPSAAEQANPGLGDLLDREDMESAVKRTPENEYRTKRRNTWTAGSKTWLPTGTWDALARPDRMVPAGTEIVMSFDGAWTGDSAALMGTTIEEVPHHFIIGSWERQPTDDDWEVPADEVDATVDQARERFRVREMPCDPHEWRREMQRWERKRIPVLEWSTSSLKRMVPACNDFYKGVVDGRMTHDGDPRLARHIANAVLKEDRYGARIVKRSSNEHIDLAVTAVMGYDRALYYTGKKPRRRRSMRTS